MGYKKQFALLYAGGFYSSVMKVWGKAIALECGRLKLHTHQVTSPVWLRRLMGAALCLFSAAALTGCDHSASVSPNKLVANENLSMADAKDVLKGVRGIFCPSIACGIVGYEITGIKLSDDQQTLIILHTDGSPGDAIPVKNLNPSHDVILFQNVVYFTEDTIPKLHAATEYDAKQLMAGLNLIKGGSGGASMSALPRAGNDTKTSSNNESDPRNLLPADAQAYKQKAETEVQNKSFAAAANFYEQALHTAPSWAEGHFNRGLILGELGKYQEAIAEINQYLALAPQAKDTEAVKKKIAFWQTQNSK